MSNEMNKECFDIDLYRAASRYQHDGEQIHAYALQLFQG